MEVPGHRGMTWERKGGIVERKPRAEWQIGDYYKGEESWLEAGPSHRTMQAEKGRERVGNYGHIQPAAFFGKVHKLGMVFIFSMFFF